MVVCNGRRRAQHQLPVRDQIETTGFGLGTMLDFERAAGGFRCCLPPRCPPPPPCPDGGDPGRRGCCCPKACAVSAPYCPRRTPAAAAVNVWDNATDPTVKPRYYKAIEAAVLRLTGATYCRATNLTLRSSSIIGVHTRAQGDYTPRGPVNDVHCDFTPEAPAIEAFGVLADAMGLGGCRYAVINCWRNTAFTAVEEWPMAVLDASTVAPGDLVPRVSPENGNTIFNVLPNDQHRWFTYPGMTDGELLLFKQYDSDPAAVRFTPHTAFDAPRASANPNPRRSCELRMLCFYADDPKYHAALKALHDQRVGLVAPAVLRETGAGAAAKL